MRKGFTLLELIFVIVILGIVSAMTFSYISIFYEGVMQQDVKKELDDEVRAIIEQLSARLGNSIKESIVTMGSSDGSGCVSLASPSANGSILAWIGVDEDGRKGMWNSTMSYYQPGWGGFADLKNSNYPSIITPESTLLSAESQILAQFGGSITNSAIYFVDSGTSSNACSDFFASGGKMYKISSVPNDTTVMLSSSSPAPEIKEQYLLSWTAYAVEWKKNPDPATDGNLSLYYNFQPWSGDKPKDGQSALLGQNITGFGFKYENGLIRLNICATKKLVGDYNVTVCREKAIW